MSCLTTFCKLVSLTFMINVMCFCLYFQKNCLVFVFSWVFDLQGYIKDLFQKATRVTTRHNTTTQDNTSATRHNTRQHKCNRKQHEYNRRQHKTTRVQHQKAGVQHEATRYNTSTKQHKIYFDLFTSSLHTRSLVYQALKLCLCCKTQKTENPFFQEQSKLNQKISRLRFVSTVFLSFCLLKQF